MEATMAFKEFAGQEQSVQLLQRSLERGRLAHAYLFTGHQLDQLEVLARTLAQTLNCRKPVKAGSVAIDCCGECVNCRKIEHGNHADVHWVRPESKSRVIVIEQMRELMQEINLKPTEAEYKVAIIVAADRLNVNAANAFLKTLEEPPAKSVLVLLSTEPQRLLETILSRCLRLNFGGGSGARFDGALLAWLAKFSEMASAEQKSLLGRYRLMDVLAQKLAEIRAGVEKALTARSPLERYEDVEKDLRDKWEEELKAAIEAEYRWQRSGALLAVQWWLRDVWLYTLAGGRELLNFPNLQGTERIAGRITTRQALENLQVIEQTQRLLHTNVQEALALEVGLLKLHL
jgi:DNA polymerase-3 subunit delta'